MMKAQFMSLWDGLDTDYSCQVSLRLLGGSLSWDIGRGAAWEQGLPEGSLPVGDSLHFVGTRGAVATVTVLPEEIGFVFSLVLIKKWCFQIRWDGLYGPSHPKPFWDSK